MPSERSSPHSPSCVYSQTPELGAVEGHPPEAHQACLGPEGQYLDEQAFESEEVTASEPGDRPVIRAGLALSKRKGTSAWQRRSVSRGEVAPTEHTSRSSFSTIFGS